MRLVIVMLALHAALAGCGSGPTPNNGLGFRDRNVLTLEEIQGARATGWTAWDLISQLRPEFLRSRGASSLRSIEPTTAVVYVDDIRYGELESLRTMSADQIHRVQYVNAADATTRYGTDHFGGAILITTK